MEEQELSRDQKLRLIYRHTHRDFKGTTNGVKSILVNRRGATCLVNLDDLTEDEIADQIGYALRKEKQMREKKATARQGRLA